MGFYSNDAIGPFLDGARTIKDTAQHLQVSEATAMQLHEQWQASGWIEPTSRGLYELTDIGRRSVYRPSSV
jgi:Mn-dependent DtxR family transcriptional regulator